MVDQPWNLQQNRSWSPIWHLLRQGIFTCLSFPRTPREGIVSRMLFSSPFFDCMDSGNAGTIGWNNHQWNVEFIILFRVFRLWSFGRSLLFKLSSHFNATQWSLKPAIFWPTSSTSLFIKLRNCNINSISSWKAWQRWRRGQESMMSRWSMMCRFKTVNWLLLLKNSN